MKTLILVRHAKASKGMRNVNDIDRPLLESGIKETYLMGHFLKKNNYKADLIISSPAVRAYSRGFILARISEYPSKKIKINENLYQKGEKGYYDVLSELKNKHKTVMLAGHNPDFENVVKRLCNQFDNEVPPGSVIVIQLKINDWDEIKNVKGEVRFFKFPKGR
jgi:phosphohistidine phosphatase